MYIVIPLIELSFCSALLVLLTISGQRHIARKPFALFLLFMALWGFFIFMMRASTSLVDALFWEKFVFGAILSAALCFYLFTVTLTDAKSPKRILLPLSIAYFALLAMLPSGLIVKGMQTMWYGKAPIIGPLFFLYVLCVYIPLSLGLARLIKYCKRSRIIDERTRYQYIIAGIIAMFVGGTTDYLPSLGLNMYPLGIIGNILFCILATIAMLKYGLMEIRVVLRKGATYSLTSMLIFGVFGSLIFLVSSIFQEMMNPISIVITLAAVFIVAAVFQPVLSRVQRIVDRWFFRERYNHIQALKQFTMETKGDLDLKQLSSSLVTTVANGMQSNGVYLLLPSPTTGNFITGSSCGQKGNGRISFSASSPLIATMKYQDNLIDVNDIDIIPSLNSLPDSDRTHLNRNAIELLLPLKNNGHLIGTMLLASKSSGEPYSNEDRQLLKMVASAVAVNIENASLYDSVKREHSQLQQATDGIIHAMSLVVESRDPYTAGHQRRVAELARAIAREMGISEWQVMGIYIAGLLHDVGKVAIPAEILSKPGKISEYEFSLIKNHPKVGYEILERIEFPWPVTRAIRQHHERLNGSGYPEGLCDEEILIEAKILAVSDVVEAMSSHRPYRPALGLDAALQEISEQRNILYDSEVVNACLRLCNKQGFEFEKLMAAATSNPKEYTITKA